MAFYKEEKETRLHRELSQKAVELAMQGRWAEAELVNRDIIERFSSDAEACNRLGRSLAKLGKFAQAKEAYIKTQDIDPSNAIARKNLERLATLSQTVSENAGQAVPQNQGIAPELFAAEMGKAGVVKLQNIASSDILAKLAAGDHALLKVAGQRLVVEDMEGVYLGEVEPKHAVRLIKLINGGNEYAAAVLHVSLDEMQLVIKETYQHPSQAGYLSFRIKDITGLRAYARGILDKPRFEESKEAEDTMDDEGSEMDGFTVLGESSEGNNGG